MALAFLIRLSQILVLLGVLGKKLPPIGQNQPDTSHRDGGSPEALLQPGFLGSHQGLGEARSWATCIEL